MSAADDFDKALNSDSATTAPPTPAADDFDKLLNGEKDPIQTTGYLAKDINPKEAEKAIVPPAPTPDLSNLQKDAPVTHAAMTQDENHHAAILPHVDALTDNEKKTKELADKNSDSEPEDDILDSLFNGFGGSLLKSASEVAGLLESPVPEMRLGIAKKISKFADSMSQPWDREGYGDIRKKAQAGDVDDVSKAIASKAGGFLSVAATFSVTPQKYIKALAGTQSLGMAKAEREELKSEGKTEVQADSAAIIDGITNYGLSVLGMAPAVKGPIRELAKDVAPTVAHSVASRLALNTVRSAGLMAGVNVAGETSHRFANWVTGIDEHAWDDYLPDLATSTLVSTVFGAGAGLHHAFSLPALAERPDVQEIINKNKQLNKNEDNSKFFLDRLKAYDDLKLDPAIKMPIFRDTLKMHGFEKSHITTDEFNEYCAKNKVDPVVAAGELNATDAYETAKKTGTLTLNTIDLMTKLAGSGHEKAFADMIRFDASDKSTNMLKDVDKTETKANTESEGEHVGIDHEAVNKEYEKKVRKEIESKLPEAKTKGEKSFRETAVNEAYTNRVNKYTGLKNEKAFQEDLATGKFKETAAFDLDNFSDLNAAVTHDPVNENIFPAMGSVLKSFEDANTKIYHKHGDEFIVLFKDKGPQNEQKMQEIKEALRNQKFAGKLNGIPFKFRGLGITHGIGEDYGRADEAATAEKRRRESLPQEHPDFKPPRGTTSYGIQWHGGTDGLPSEKSGVKDGGRTVVPTEAKATATGEPVHEPVPGTPGQGDIDNGKIAEEVNKSVSGFSPLFEDMKAAGFSEESAKRYVDSFNKVGETVFERAKAKAKKLLERLGTPAFKREWKSIREEEAKDWDKNPGVIAKSVLETGKMPDGSKLPDAIKDLSFEKGLAEEDLPDAYRFKKTPQLENLAEELGFSSADEMIKKVAETPEREYILDKAANDAMQQLHGEETELSTKELEQLAASQLSDRANQEAKQLFSTQFAKAKGLVKKIAGKFKSTEEVESDAENLTRGGRQGDINSKAYKLEAQRHNNDAVKYMVGGEWDKMADAKYKEQLNLELYKRALDEEKFQQKTEKTVKQIGKSSVRSKLSESKGDEVALIDQIAKRFGFKGVNKQSVPTRTLDDWVARQKEGQNKVQFSDLVMGKDEKSYQDLTNDEFHSVADAINALKKSAERNAKQELLNPMLKSGATSLLNAEDEITAAIEAHHEIKPEESTQVPKTAGESAKSWWNSFRYVQHKLDIICDKLNGWKKLGPVWEAFIKPMKESELDEKHIMDDVMQKHINEYNQYTDKERKELDKVFAVPELKGWMGNFDGRVTRHMLIKAFAYRGNGYSEEAMDWTTEQWDATAKHLNEKDLNIVKSMWKTEKTMWAKTQKLEFDVNGITPRGTIAKPYDVKLSDGKTYRMDGGHTHLDFNDTRSEELNEKNAVQKLFNVFTPVKTNQGRMKGRVGTGGRMPDLTMTSWTRSTGEAIHDVAWRKTIMDGMTLTNNDKIKKSIIGALGKEAYGEFKPMYKDLSGAREPKPYWFLERQSAKLRQSMTSVELAFNFMTAFKHIPNMALAFPDLGLKYSVAAMKNVALNPFRMAEMEKTIHERSPWMRDVRFDAGDREAHDAMLNIEQDQTLSARQKSMKKAGLYLMRYMDRLVSYADHDAAYQKVMTEGLPESGIKPGDHQSAVDYADSIVEQAKGSGGTRSLSRIQRGPEALKLMTSFFSPENNIYNFLEKSFSKFSASDHGFADHAGLASAMALGILGPSTFFYLLKGEEHGKHPVASWMGNAMLYATRPILGVGSMIQSAYTGLTEHKWDFDPVPAFGAMKNIAESSAMVLKPILHEINPHVFKEPNKQDVDAMARTIGYKFKLPSEEAMKIAHRVIDWTDGQNKPGRALGIPGTEPISGVYEALVSGEKRRDR